MLAVATLDIAKMRAEAAEGTDPIDGPESLKTALVLMGVMQPDEQLDDLPDTIDY